MDRARSRELSSLHVPGGLIHYIYSNDSIAKPAFKALPGRDEGPSLWAVGFSGGYLVAWHLHQPIQEMMGVGGISCNPPAVAYAGDPAAARGVCIY